MTFAITGDTEADHLLNTDGTALLIGMLLDQQVPMEWAFRGPKTLAERLGHLDATRIAAMSEDEVVEVCAAKPAIHRFPKAMGRRIHALCIHLAEQYGGEAPPSGATTPTPPPCTGGSRRCRGSGRRSR